MLTPLNTCINTKISVIFYIKTNLIHQICKLMVYTIVMQKKLKQKIKYALWVHKETKRDLGKQNRSNWSKNIGKRQNNKLWHPVGWLGRVVSKRLALADTKKN